ncbi:MAG: hypothetical protein PHV62_05800 [Sulfuricurvum sp.]|nr:hypothetical protein [Sulfuricurvum sp.]
MFSGSQAGASGGMGSSFNGGEFGSGLAGFLGGMFGDSGQPYDDAMQQYQKYAGQGAGVQNPFLKAGTGAIPDYQKWLQGQADPSGFINHLMGQYKASPYSQYLQQQAQRGGQNAASASGLMGSTPLMEQMQTNSANIASGDMNQWLQNVLGINTQYGQGQQNLMQGGQGAANALTGLYSNMGANMGQMAYGQGAAQNNDFMNMLGGGAQIAGAFLGL